jgi:hypothetical protein
MRPSLRVGTVYDFRNTPESGMDTPSLYAAIIDQVVMLDGLGLDLVWVHRAPLPRRRRGRGGDQERCCSGPAFA